MKRHASMLAFAPADNLGPANWARLCFEPWEEAWEPAENPCGHIKSLRTKSSRLEWDSRHCCCREVTKSATAPLCSAEKVHVGFGSLFKWGRNKQVGLQISSCKAGGKILCTFKRGQIFVLFWVCFFSSCFTKVLQLENFFFFFFKVVRLQSNILPVIYLEAICKKKRGTAADLNGRQSIQQAPLVSFQHFSSARSIFPCQQVSERVITGAQRSLEITGLNHKLTWST